MLFGLLWTDPMLRVSECGRVLSPDVMTLRVLCGAKLRVGARGRRVGTRKSESERALVASAP